MSIPQKIKDYLESKKIKYQILEHPLAYTASEIAGTQHVPGKQMVKSVIVKADKEFIMCLLPAIQIVDFEKLAKVTGANDIQLADESDVAHLFPDFEVGAEPPFGHPLRVFADQILDEDEEIVCNAGTHTDLIRMKYADFKKVVEPTVAKIGTHI